MQPLADATRTVFTHSCSPLLCVRVFRFNIKRLSSVVCLTDDLYENPQWNVLKKIKFVVWCFIPGKYKLWKPRYLLWKVKIEKKSMYLTVFLLILKNCSLDPFTITVTHRWFLHTFCILVWFEQIDLSAGNSACHNYLKAKLRSHSLHIDTQQGITDINNTGSRIQY